MLLDYIGCENDLILVMNVSTAKRAELEKRLAALVKKAPSERSQALTTSDESDERAAKRLKLSELEGKEDGRTKEDGDRSSQQGRSSTVLVRFLDYQLSVVFYLI